MGVVTVPAAVAEGKCGLLKFWVGEGGLSLWAERLGSQESGSNFHWFDSPSVLLLGFRCESVFRKYTVTWIKVQLCYFLKILFFNDCIQCYFVFVSDVQHRSWITIYFTKWSPDISRTKVPNRQVVDKYMGHIYSGVLLSHIREWNDEFVCIYAWPVDTNHGEVRPGGVGLGEDWKRLMGERKDLCNRD